MTMVTGAAPTGQRLVAAAMSSLRELLPPGWDMEVDREPRSLEGVRPDLIATVVSPDGERAVFVVACRSSGAGASAKASVGRLRRYLQDLPGARPLFVAPWLSERSRELLAAEDVGYLDATGNARLVADRPGLVVKERGADSNPWPADSGLRSLRGKGAARAVRALVDHTPPYGVRELAGRTGASAATLSRVIDLLETEGLVDRDARGGVSDLDWAGSLRRWAVDYDVMGTNDPAAYLAPRGLPDLVERLRATDIDYALTGSLAANELAPYAPARLGMLYVGSPSAAAEALDLRSVETGGNVILLLPYDDVVRARTIERSGLRLANPSQLVVDLLTGPGRAPSEGEELLGWMEEHLDAWRA